MPRRLAPRTRRQLNAAGLIGSDRRPHARFAFARNISVAQAHKRASPIIVHACQGTAIILASSARATQGTCVDRFNADVRNQDRCIKSDFVSECPEHLTASQYYSPQGDQQSN